jgi:LPXTG-motif cell wall-anchored protein
MKKTSLYIIGGLAVAAIAGFIFFRKKGKDANDKSLPLESKSNDADVETKITKEGKAGTSKPAKPTQGSTSTKGGNSVYRISSTTITKISRLKNTPMGQRLDLGSKDATTITNLQNFVDGLSKDDKRLFGYLVNLDERRVKSGEFQAQLEQKEGEGSFEKLVTIDNQFKVIAEGGAANLESSNGGAIVIDGTSYTPSEFAMMQAAYNSALGKLASVKLNSAEARNTFIKAKSGLNDLQITHLNKYAEQKVGFASEESDFAFGGHLY